VLNIILYVDTYIGFRDESSLKFSHSKIRTPVEIILKFTPTTDIEPNEMIIVNMPKFTDGRSLGNLLRSENDNLIITPSLQFRAEWIEGHYNRNIDPYNTSAITLMLREGQLARQYEAVTLTILAENGLRAYCGFPSEVSLISYNAIDDFRITSNTTGATIALEREQMGIGCSLYSHCGVYGLCDFCNEKCYCKDGFGSLTDTLMNGRPVVGNCDHRKLSIFMYYELMSDYIQTHICITAN
jgi:hypothetical protein